MKRGRSRKARSGCMGRLLGYILFLIIAAAGLIAGIKYMPSREYADLDTLYAAGGSDRVALYLNYERQSESGVYADGQTYLPVTWINDNLNERFYWDLNENILVYALPDEIIKSDETTLDEDGKKIIYRDGDTVYLSLSLIKKYTDVRIQNFDSDTRKRVFVENGSGQVTVAEVAWGAKVRLKGGLKSAIVTGVKRHDAVMVLEQYDHWLKVMTEDGHIGYVLKCKMKNIHEEELKSDFVEPVYQNISMEQKIVLVWHQVTIAAANQAMDSLIAKTKGVNVIAPTWFTLSSNSGSYESLADKSYVERAHEKGLKVWAVVDNFSRECSQNVQSEELLSRTSVREKLIANLMTEAEKYGFDGINLDFESLKTEAGVHYIEFIRELSVSCRKNGLVLSVDNYVPASYNSFYDYKEQGVVADYVIIMGYDEHYAGGEAGSVSSIGYVENGIKDMLSLVPAEKVINAVPFYTRLWTINGDNISSRAMGISEAAKWVSDNKMELSWDDSVGQYYGEIDSEDDIRKLWMEDEKSLELKMNLIKKYDLAGVAGWRLGLETSDVWDVIGWE